MLFIKLIIKRWLLNQRVVWVRHWSRCSGCEQPALTWQLMWSFRIDLAGLLIAVLECVSLADMTHTVCLWLKCTSWRNSSVPPLTIEFPSVDSASLTTSSLDKSQSTACDVAHWASLCAFRLVLSLRLKQQLTAPHRRRNNHGHQGALYPFCRPNLADTWPRL